MSVIRLKNPLALTVPEVVALFEKAFKGDRPVSAAVALAELSRLIASPYVAVFLGEEARQYKALAIMIHSASPLFGERARVFHFFNTGSKMLRDSCIEAVIQQAKDWGYDGLLVANFSGKTDQAWKTAFRSAGTFRKAGTVFEIDFPEAQEGPVARQEAERWAT